MSNSESASTMLSVTQKPHRKTRTGCRTCKLRRVKCDESYPACRRCICMGRVCDGYGVWGGGGALDRDAKAPPRSVHSLRVTRIGARFQTASIPMLRVTSEEQGYLEWFFHGTAIKPPRIFNSTFWDPAILQATVHEPMILQALLALSAAHKRHVLDPANRARDGLVPDALEVFLLRHYCSAIKGLQGLLDIGEEISRSQRFAAVILSALFVLIELMRGHFEAGHMHLSNGAHIAKQLTDERGQTKLDPVFIQFFARLQDQTMLFRREPTPRSITTSSAVPAVPKLRFASPAEAGYHLDDLIEQVAHTAQQTRLMPCSAIASRAMHYDVCRYLLVCFESWSLACAATVAERRSALTPVDAAAYEALQRRYRAAKSIAENSLGSGRAIAT